MKIITNVLLLFLLFNKCIQGFNIKSFNNLQSIISLKAFTSTLADRLNIEYVNENLILNDVLHHNTHIEVDVFYFLLLTASIMQRSKQEVTYIKKLEKFEGFSVAQKRTNKCFFILAIVFTRNIDNAI